MKKEEIKKVVIDSIKSTINGIEGIPITPESELNNDLGMDSLDFVEIIMEIEKRTNTMIPDEITEVGIVTVQDLIDKIEPYINNK